MVSYLLGVDLGTTYTAAAVVAEGRAEVIPLGNRSSVVPTVVYLREDEQILVGETANRRSLTDPGRVAREFKRRVGDSAPILLGGSPLSPQSLMAKMLRWVVDHVAAQRGAMPDHIAVSHPANWGPYKLDLFEQAIRMADLTDCTTVTEPEAAAAYYASYERMEPQEAVAVYDLGGGTFDAAIVRRTEVGFDILGTPEGIEHLGGIDIDEGVFAYVRDALDGALDRLDPTDPTALAAVARLRQECVEAKEALSSDIEVSIPVLLPGLHSQVPLTREQLESMIRPLLGDTITAMRRALRSAQMAPDDIRAVLLVGGSSRIPLVADLASKEFGRPVAVDTHPKHSVALGTALAAEEAVARGLGLEPAPIHVVEPRPTPQHGPERVQGGGPAVVPLPVPTAGASTDATTPAASAAPAVTDTPVSTSPAGSIESSDVTTAMDENRHQSPSTATVRADAVTVAPHAPAEDAAVSDAAARDGGHPETDTSGGDGNGGLTRRRLTTLVAGGAAAVVAITALVLIFNGRDTPADEPATEDAASGTEAPGDEVEGEDDEEASSEPETDAGTEPDEPELDPSVACDGTACIGIDAVGLQGSDLVVDWTAAGFQPDVDEVHAHFFWDVYDAGQAGTNASELGHDQAPWEITDESPFVPENEMLLIDRPSDATEICVTAGDSEHAVLNPDNVHCVPLPEDVDEVAFCDDTLCIEFYSVSIQDDELHVMWDPSGFEPDTSGTHAHFFWDVYEPDQVGTNAEEDYGVERAPWELTDERPFVPTKEMRLSQRPEDADRICVTVADGDHAVIEPSNYQCVPLPDGA